MSEEKTLTELERTELEAYRKLFDEMLKEQKPNNNGANKKDLLSKISYFLGVFVACGIISFIMQIIWNFTVIKLWPQIPQITMFQMAGLWFLCHILLGSRNK
jgi:hypothetical protein